MQKISLATTLVATMLLAAAPASAQQVAVDQSVQPQYREQPRNLGFGLGLRAHVAYDGDNSLGFYGGGAVFRYVFVPRFGLELTIDGAAHQDQLLSVPISLSALVFFNTRRHVQPYLLGGAHVMVRSDLEHEASAVYSGGHVGIGVEFLVGRHLGLTLDARTFVQGLIDDDHDDSDWGLTFNTGFNFYM